jgi:hypothetical protein
VLSLVAREAHTGRLTTVSRWDGSFFKNRSVKVIDDHFNLFGKSSIELSNSLPFPPEKPDQALRDFAEALRAFVSRRLGWTPST